MRRDNVLSCDYGSVMNYVYVTSWLCVKLWDHTCVLRCWVHWVVSYESYSHTIVRPFKGDELMRNEYCDGIHSRNLTSLITLRHDELKLFWEQLRSRVFCTINRWSLHAKMFSGLDLNQEGEALVDSSECRPWG